MSALQMVQFSSIEQEFEAALVINRTCYYLRLLFQALVLYLDEMSL